MTEQFKAGDPVKVKFVGKVLDFTDGRGRIAINVDGKDFSSFVFPDQCTKITPPLKVGDKIQTPEEALKLPNRAAFHDRFGDLYEKQDDIGRKFSGTGVSAWWYANELHYPLTVIYLPEKK